MLPDSQVPWPMCLPVEHHEELSCLRTCWEAARWICFGAGHSMEQFVHAVVRGGCKGSAMGQKEFHAFYLQNDRITESLRVGK